MRSIEDTGAMTPGPIESLLVSFQLDGDPDARQLITAESLTADAVADVRRMVKDDLGDVTGLDIVGFGSLARSEWTTYSDFDYLVLIHDVDIDVNVVRQARRVAEKARRMLGAREPGTTGMFGAVVSAYDMVGRLGLEDDTNQSLSRRILMLEESVSLFDQSVHERLLSGVLSRYLVEYQDIHKVGVPRFLLNDVVRYWRTLAVDYQAKNWQRLDDTGWGLRYAKLLITRKLAFAAMLTVLLMPALESHEPTPEYLMGKLQLPALARLGLLSPHLTDGGRRALLDIYRVAGRFNRCLAKEDFREEAAKVAGRRGIDQASEEFKATVEDAQGLLHDALTELFFGSSDELRKLTVKYALF